MKEEMAEATPKREKAIGAKAPSAPKARREEARKQTEGPEGNEAVPRTPWLGQDIQPVSVPLTPCTEKKTGLRSTNPMSGRRPLTPGASPAGACSVP